jgi:hypothetical protein
MSRRSKSHQKKISPVEAVPVEFVPTRIDVRPTDVDIQKRAYEIYFARGGEAGHALEDWLCAEKEIIHA